MDSHTRSRTIQTSTGPTHNGEGNGARPNFLLGVLLSTGAGVFEPTGTVLYCIPVYRSRLPPVSFYRYCTVHSPSSRRFVSCAQPVVAPPAQVCMGAGRSAPVEPAVDAKNSSSTIAFPIKLFKDSSPIGILLQGNSNDPPTIIDVSEDSPAVRARPRLAVGMRILSINGIAVHGPYEASQLLRAAVGIVELEVEGEESLVKGADIYWFPIFKIVELRKRAVSRLECRHAGSTPRAHEIPSGASQPTGREFAWTGSRRQVSRGTQDC